MSRQISPSSDGVGERSHSGLSKFAWDLLAGQMILAQQLHVLEGRAICSCCGQDVTPRERFRMAGEPVSAVEALDPSGRCADCAWMGFTPGRPIPSIAVSAEEIVDRLLIEEVRGDWDAGWDIDPWDDVEDERRAA